VSPLLNGAGIVYASMSCGLGSSGGIARWFGHMFAAPTSIDCDTAVVECGVGQALYFTETSSAELRRSGGGHFCLYLSQFARAFDLAKERRILWTHADRSDFVTDWPSAKRFRQFRIAEVVDDDGTTIFECEMEIRSTAHRHCARQLRAPSASA